MAADMCENMQVQSVEILLMVMGAASQNQHYHGIKLRGLGRSPIIVLVAYNCIAQRNVIFPLNSTFG
jgi:hypothetical protein